MQECPQLDVIILGFPLAGECVESFGVATATTAPRMHP